MTGRDLEVLAAMRQFPVRLVALAVLALLPLGRPAVASAQETLPRFRSAVDLVPVAAVVRDDNGRPVTGLGAEDFVVLDAGQPRRVVAFREDEVAPASVTVLVDESGSMRASAGAARRAVTAILDVLSMPAVRGDELALTGFDSSLREIVTFTTDFGLVRRALAVLDAYGATSMHDAIAAGAERLATREGGRRALVVITDGVDTRSRLTLEQVSGMAAAIDVPVYLFLVGRAPDDAVRHAATEARATLSDLARWTGGDLFVAGSAVGAYVAAGRFVQDLRHQYLFAFESAGEPGWRILDIRTRRSHQNVRARSAYVAGRQAQRSGR